MPVIVAVIMVTMANSETSLFSSNGSFDFSYLYYINTSEMPGELSIFTPEDKHVVKLHNLLKST